MADPPCTAHSQPIVSGCKVCLKFFCPECLNSEKICKETSGGHVYLETGELVKIFHQKIKENLQSVQEKCKILGEDGNNALTEFEEERKRVIELMDAQGKKITEYIKDVQRDADNAQRESDIRLRPGSSRTVEVAVLLDFSLPQVSRRSISLDKRAAGDSPVNVLTTEQVAGTTEQRPIHTKFLRFVCSPGYEGEIFCSLEKGRIVAVTSVDDQDTIKIYKSENERLAQGGPDVEITGGRKLFAVSSDGDKQITRHPDGTCFYITHSANDEQQITKDWCTAVTNVIWVDLEKLILFFTNNSVKVYSLFNAPKYTLRKEIVIALETDKTPKSFMVGDNKFCLYYPTKLEMYEFNPTSFSVELKWHYDADEGQKFGAGCYSAAYRKILLSDEKGVMIINPEKGSGEKVERIETPEIGLDQSIIDLLLFEDHFLFVVSEDGYPNIALVYKLELTKE